MFGRILAVMLKELRQLSRDRLTFGMIVGIPLMQMLLFGYAINFDVRGIRAAVVDEADTSHSRALIADLGATGVVRFLAPSASVGDAAAAAERGRDQRRRRTSRQTSSDADCRPTAQPYSCSSTAASR